MYVYPVVGRKVCASTIHGCQAIFSIFSLEVSGTDACKIVGVYHKFCQNSFSACQEIAQQLETPINSLLANVHENHAVYKEIRGTLSWVTMLMMERSRQLDTKIAAEECGSCSDTARIRQRPPHIYASGTE